MRERGYETTIRWVPAHSGVLGNEQADCAAVEVTGISLVIGKWASLTYLRHSIRKDSDRENSDTTDTHLRLRIIKGKAEYLLKKDKKIN